jgi:ABC-2 type transport system ATP-binding protein
MELALDLCDEIVILSGGVLEKMEKDDLSNEGFKDKIIQALRKDEND